MTLSNEEIDEPINNIEYVRFSNFYRDFLSVRARPHIRVKVYDGPLLLIIMPHTFFGMHDSYDGLEQRINEMGYF